MTTKRVAKIASELDDKTDGKTVKKSWGGARPNTGGKRPGSGRKKGSPNKFTMEIKSAIVEAFERKGGAEYLMKVADEKPEVFCSLLGKVLPMQITGDGGGPLIISWGDNNADDNT